MDELKVKIEEFNATSKTIHIAFGGDGTLLTAVHDNPKKVILPVRDYCTCEDHNPKDVIDYLIGLKKLDRDVKLNVFPQIIGYYHDDNNIDKIMTDSALAEIVIKNKDISTALRFDVYVNGHLYLENVICDGLIATTAFGSHGYFKSVTRTMFYEGIGLAFIAPTYGICNLVLKTTDVINIRFKRDAVVNLAADKNLSEIAFNEGNIFTIEGCCNNVMIGRYSEFMCNKCRKLRNSTTINDQYFV